MLHVTIIGMLEHVASTFPTHWISIQQINIKLVYKYCIPGNFSDVETLANLAINSFSLKLQVANLVLHCNLQY